MTQSGQSAGPFQLPFEPLRSPEIGASMPLFNIGFVIFPDLTQLDFTDVTTRIINEVKGSIAWSTT